MPADFSCNLNDLIQAAKCLSDVCMSESDRKAIQIYARVASLAASGGTDYRNNLSLLLKDSRLWQLQSCDTLQAVDTYITILDANDNGAALGTDPKAILAEAKCMRGGCLGKEQTRGVLEFLKCALNQLDSPA